MELQIRKVQSYNKLGPNFLAYFYTKNTAFKSKKMEVSQLDIDQILVQTPQGTETLILDTYRNTNSVFFCP